MAVDRSTTQDHPPQHPVESTVAPVSVYLHRNVHESMEMNQTLLAVFVVRKDVLLIPVSIVLNLLVRVVMDQRVVTRMVQ